MRKLNGSFFILLILASASNVLSYETQTHALITRQAFSRSTIAIIGDNSVLNRTGLSRLALPNIFSPYWLPGASPAYYLDGDGIDGAEWIDAPDIFEKCQMRAFLTLTGQPRDQFALLFQDTVELEGDPEKLPLQNWLVRGAIREDDMGDGIGRLGLTNELCMAEWEATIDEQPGRITRSLRHFFDPDFDVGLWFLGSYPKSVDWALGNHDSFARPPSAATGDERNTFSYRDARNAYWWALTRKKRESEVGVSSVARGSDAVDRMMLWATVFRSLGNVVHLLQDAAQPQHSRVDPHSGLNSPQRQAFEGFTNARILGGGNVGAFVKGFYSPPFEPSNLSVPGLGVYGQGSASPFSTIQFATPLRFFTTREGLNGTPPGFAARAGLADYSNRGFFTGGTLPGMEGSNPHRAPPQDFDSPASGYSTSYSPCEAWFILDARIRNVSCLHFLHAVPDAVDPDYANSADQLPQGYNLPNVPIAADGLFREFFRFHGEPFPKDISSVTWSPTVLEAIGNLTIPRAIGYSAGMLNFFFRGEIALTSPPDGLYAVADQGTPHNVVDGIPMDATGKVFGFKNVRVRVRNTTMVDTQGNHTLRDSGSGTIIPQTMRGGVDATGAPTGRLVAIARYHRNPCYERDLSGEYVVMPDPITGIPNLNDRRIPNGCSVANARTAFQEISVSAPLSLDANGNLPGPPSGASNACLNVGNINTGAHGVGADCDEDSPLAEFDFSGDPIPVNATDLFLQVAYRGPLGLEDDGIAVGLIDVNEANYFSMWNGTDWYYRSGEWVPPEHFPDLPTWVDWEPTPIDDMVACFGPQTIVDLAPGEAIQPGEFLRIAVLSDANPVPFGIYAVVGRYGNYMPLGAGQTTRQSWMEDAATAPYNPQPFLWYGRGTVTGSNFLAPFFTSGEAPVNNTMQSLILHPYIGGASPGIARPVTAKFDAHPDKCKPQPSVEP